MEASSAAHDTGVTPEELKKTRSCKWFRRGSKSTSVSPAPASGVSRIQGKEKEHTPSAAPIPLSTVPLVVNFFPSAVMLSRSWSFIFLCAMSSLQLVYYSQGGLQMSGGTCSIHRSALQSNHHGWVYFLLEKICLQNRRAKIKFFPNCLNSILFISFVSSSCAHIHLIGLALTNSFAATWVWTAKSRANILVWINCSWKYVYQQCTLIRSI